MIIVLLWDVSFRVIPYICRIANLERNLFWGLNGLLIIRPMTLAMTQLNVEQLEDRRNE